MLKSFNLGGTELAPFVVTWADIEQVKEVLLAKTTLLAGELNIECSNINGQFSPENQGSLFYGRNLFNTEAYIRLDGQLIFTGYLKSIDCDSDKKTASFKMQDILTIPADGVLPPQTLTGVDPMSAALALFNSMNLLYLVDVPSFLSAGINSTANGATVNVVISGNKGDSLLSVLDSLSDLSSVSIYVQNGLIRAKPFTISGSGFAGLKQPITPANVRSFGKRTTNWDIFNNSVTVGYGSSLIWTLTDPVSIAVTGITRNYAFSTGDSSEILSVPNISSAQYFATQYLARAETPPITIDVTCGQEFMENVIGDRFPVTCPNWGYVSAPFELIETHHQVTQNQVQMVLKNLSSNVVA